MLPGDAPTYQPEIEEIVHGIETIPLEKITATRAFFKCTFTESSTEDLFYRVAWYQDNFQMIVSDFGNAVSDTAFKLTENIFVESGFQLGHTVNNKHYYSQLKMKTLIM